MMTVNSLEESADKKSNKPKLNLLMQKVKKKLKCSLNSLEIKQH